MKAARAQTRLERLGDVASAVLAHRSLRAGEPREHDVERLLVGADAQRADLLGEQPAPRRAGADLLLGEDLLLRLGEQVRPVAALRAQVVAGEVQPVGGEQLLGLVVVERRPLEPEEEQLGLDRRAELLHLLEQRAARWVGRVRGEAQARVGARLARQLLEVGELAHRLDEAGAVELGDPARVAVGEGDRAAVGLLELGERALVAARVDQGVEVPFGLEQLGVVEEDVGARHGSNSRSSARRTQGHPGGRRRAAGASAV